MKKSQFQIELEKRFEEIGVEGNDLTQQEWVQFSKGTHKVVVWWKHIGDFGCKEVRVKIVRLIPV